MHLKIPSAKRQPFCPGGDELNSPKTIHISPRRARYVVSVVGAVAATAGVMSDM